MTLDQEEGRGVELQVVPGEIEYHERLQLADKRRVVAKVRRKKESEEKKNLDNGSKVKKKFPTQQTIRLNAMASASPSTQAPPAAPPSEPGAAAPNVSDSSRAEQEQSSASAGGIGRRIRLATMLPRKLGRVALGLVLGRGKKKTQQQQYGGLKDVVSYSSRRMAAGRALEYELGREGGALFLDPLAAALAG